MLLYVIISTPTDPIAATSRQFSHIIINRIVHYCNNSSIYHVRKLVKILTLDISQVNESIILCAHKSWLFHSCSNNDLTM